MDEKKLLIFLYNSDTTWINLADYFLKEYKDISDSDYKNISDKLQKILDYKLLAFTDKNMISMLGKMQYSYPHVNGGLRDSKFTFEEINRRRNLMPKEENYGLMAQITFEGKLQVDKWLLENQLKEVNQAVIDSAKFGKLVRNATIASAFIAGITAIFIGLQFWKDDSQDLRPLYKQLEKTSIILDSMLQSQKGIDSSLQKAVKDSFYAPLPRHK